MTNRDRLAADLHAEVCIASSIDWDLCVIDHRDEADRLIKRGWMLAPVPKMTAYSVLPSGRLRGWKGDTE